MKKKSLKSSQGSRLGKEIEKYRKQKIQKKKKRKIIEKLGSEIYNQITAQTAIIDSFNRIFRDGIQLYFI